MVQNITDTGAMVWSGILQGIYYQNLQKAINLAPIYLSESLVIRKVKDVTVRPTSNYNATLLGGTAIVNTEYEDEEIKLVRKVLEEDIPITSEMIGSEWGFSLTEKAMYDCAYDLGLDHSTQVKTILTTDANFVAAREVDVVASKWNTAGATPAANIATLRGKFITSTQCDIDDPRIYMYIGQTLWQHVEATTDYKNYKANRITPEQRVLLGKMQDYFNIDNIIILPESFGAVCGLVFVENPQISYPEGNK